MFKKIMSGPMFWGSIILIISQVLVFIVAFRERVYVDTYQISSPDVAVQFPLAYFFGAVVVWAVVLFFVPLKNLKIIFRVIFALLFAWGMFIVLVFFTPLYACVVIAVICGMVWFFIPRVWLHNLLLIFALAGIGAVFGFFLSPWTAMAFMLVVSVYDFVAVRFGFMMWMAEKLSGADTLPAFIIPAGNSRWNIKLGETRLKPQAELPAKREYSILGGGDIGLALVLVVSVFFMLGFTHAVIVGFFSLLGLNGAYLIQCFWLKGKPIPAMPPITLLSLIGLLIVYYAL
ncbi:presenilin family intramembrane aspartyl protease [Chloroflexota bacterium]